MRIFRRSGIMFNPKAAAAAGPQQLRVLCEEVAKQRSIIHPANHVKREIETLAN